MKALTVVTILMFLLNSVVSVFGMNLFGDDPLLEHPGSPHILQSPAISAGTLAAPWGARAYARRCGSS